VRWSVIELSNNIFVLSVIILIGISHCDIDMKSFCQVQNAFPEYTTDNSQLSGLWINCGSPLPK
jgi:hypothetical protein